jgi:hypothetical protein
VAPRLKGEAARLCPPLKKRTVFRVKSPTRRAQAMAPDEGQGAIEAAA